LYERERSLPVNDVARFTQRGEGWAWTVVISTVEGTDPHDGTLTTLSPIVEAVINTLGATLPSSINLLEMRLETQGTNITKPSLLTSKEEEKRARQDI
jgi:hypothetical protein